MQEIGQSAVPNTYCVVFKQLIFLFLLLKGEREKKSCGILPVTKLTKIRQSLGANEAFVSKTERVSKLPSHQGIKFGSSTHSEHGWD